LARRTLILIKPAEDAVVSTLTQINTRSSAEANNVFGNRLAVADLQFAG